ncbi:MAG: hypothetical protein L6R41_002993 [Letrouitia leprolyta]|nr:MAG: hypothetical protein L6R41_002993 [Letrouitia leprolyta]
MRNHDDCANSLGRGNDTFTLKKLRRIIRKERISRSGGSQVRARFRRDIVKRTKEVACEVDTGFFDIEKVDGGLRCFSNQTARLRAIAFCKRLYGHDSPVSIAAADIDEAFSKIFKFKFEPSKYSRAIVKQACDLLERLPAWPPELNDIPPTVPAECRVSSIARDCRRDLRLWEQLQVTTYVSTTVLRFTLSVVTESWTTSTAAASLLDITDIIAFLLETVSQLAPTITDVQSQWRSFIVRAFLWTTWQRCQLLYFHQAATNAMKWGSSDGKKGQLSLRGTTPCPGMTIHEMSQQYAGIGKPEYMCSWNFELLRINSICIGADF